MTPKTSQVNFQCDPDTRHRLDIMANASGRSRSAFLRWLINKTWQEFKSDPRNDPKYFESTVYTTDAEPKAFYEQVQE